MDARFHRTQFVLRKKLLKIFGGAFWIRDVNSGELLMYSKQKAFRLREDIRVFTDEEMTTELLTIKARQMIDFAATYDVTDATTGENLGALRRRGLKSMVRDEWAIIDPVGQEIGTIKEDSTALALVRRFLFNLLPQSFTAEINGRLVAQFHQNWNFFLPKIRLDFSANQAGLLDVRLGIAAAILLAAIEGRQREY
jgi:hypothetical protein